MNDPNKNVPRHSLRREAASCTLSRVVRRGWGLLFVDLPSSIHCGEVRVRQLVTMSVTVRENATLQERKLSLAPKQRMDKKPFSGMEGKEAVD